MSPENHYPERLDIPRLPELPQQLEAGGQAFLDALVPDEAAREMQKVHDGSVPIEAAARDAIRLGYALGYTVEKTDTEDKGRAIFRWVDAEGATVYEGPAQDNLTQLALMFAAKREEYLQGDGELHTKPDFTFTMPFNVIGGIIQGAVVPQAETSSLSRDEVVEYRDEKPLDLDTVSESDMLGYGQEVTAHDLVGFSFGPPLAHARVSKPEAVQPAYASDASDIAQALLVERLVPPDRSQRVSGQQLEPMPRIRPERLVKLRRRVTATAIAAAALVSSVILHADSSPKTSQSGEVPVKSLPKGHRTEPVQPEQVVSEVHDIVGDFTVTSLSGNVQFIEGSMNQGRNPWQMTEEALHIAGIKADTEAVTQADPYLQTQRARRAAQHLGAGAVMSWRVVRNADGARLIPQPLPFQR